MPTWGITPEMRETCPWGIPSTLLEPAKTQTDPVHGDIHWTELERQIIDSRPFQRLRYVKQLGTTNRVYPGAEHSRLTHCLGTLKVAQDILDRVLSARTGPHPIEDLFASWDDTSYMCRLAEAVVLTRLTALMHDLTHVPFGHTIEDDLHVLTSHDRNVERFDKLWSELPPAPRQALEQGKTHFPSPDRFASLEDELRAIILDKVPLPSSNTETEDGSEPNISRSSYPFVSDIVNNTICADLLDYIQRDHLFLGLPIGLGDRFMDNFYVAPQGEDVSYPERLVVRITREAEPRTDVTTEILKHLRYRYEETERALYHKTKLAFDAMLGKLLEMLSDEYWLQEALRDYPQLGTEDQRTDADWVRLRVSEFIVAQGGTGDDTLAGLARYDERARERMEKLFTFFGDDGLLEHLIWQWTEVAEPPNERVCGILELANRVRYREGFKVVGHTVGEGAKREASQKYSKFGNAGARRRLERYAARVAGVDPAWQVVIWLPSPEMRLKVAEVLVDDGESVYELGVHDRDAKQIVERHMHLWAMRLYAPTHIRDNKRVGDVLRGCILEKTGIQMSDSRGDRARPLNELAAQRVGDLVPLNTAQIMELSRKQTAAKSDNWTFRDGLHQAWLSAHQEGMVPTPQPPPELFA